MRSKRISRKLESDTLLLINKRKQLLPATDNLISNRTVDQVIVCTRMREDIFIDLRRNLKR